MNLRLPNYKTALFGCTLLVGLLTALPYITHMLHPAYEGMTVTRDKDFGNYYSRMERALRGHFGEADNGITPVGSGAEGVQIAGVELFLGAVFGWTGISAPTLSVLIGPVISAFVFLLLVWLYRTIGFSSWWALGMACIYFAVAFHTVTRFVHPGWSFVPAFGALITFFRYRKNPSTQTAILSVLLLALMPYVYFWSWTFSWGVVGGVILLALASGREDGWMRSYWKQIVLMGGITIALSIPFFLHTIEASHHPAYSQVEIRGSFLFQRTVESWPRSILLLIQTVTLLSLFPKRKAEWSYLCVSALIIGILIAMHQNVIHGKILMFSSHFYPQLLVATLAVGTWAIAFRAPLIHRGILVGITLLFLGGAAYDYHDGHRFLFPREADFEDQHLVEPIRYFANNGTQDLILTDHHTGRLLMSWTDDGIVYTTHARFLLISDADIAERFCVSELFAPEIPDAYRTIYIEYNHILDSPEMRAQEKAYVDEACVRVRANPVAYMQKYGVTHVLWNQDMEPDWDMQQYDIPMTETDAGDGWILYAVSASTSS